MSSLRTLLAILKGEAVVLESWLSRYFGGVK